MRTNQLFARLCTPAVIKYGWHLAQNDSRDDFISDPAYYADFASGWDRRLAHLCEQVENYRYRPKHLIEIDIPKTGLSVRPGNVLPIEESSLLHAIVYLLAPLLDKRLDKKVYSYRLHPQWEKKARKGESMFAEGGDEFPFLKHVTIRKIDPMESWYSAWRDFEAAAARALNRDGYTHLTKTDIASYFENIDLHILEAQVRQLLRRNEDSLLEVLFRVLNGWTRTTSTGTPVGRGIPQGNDVSSFLGNLYLIPLDRALEQFCRSRKATWYRYVDDVRVFTKCERDAREAVFVINDALRGLHLNLQGSKTCILSGAELRDEMDESEVERVNRVSDAVRRVAPPDSPRAKAAKRKSLRSVQDLTRRFQRSQKAFDRIKEDSRLFRRLLTVAGQCESAALVKPALESLRGLPDNRILLKSLRYLTQQHYVKHDGICDTLLQLVLNGDLPFPYQVAQVFDTFKALHPSAPENYASKIRRLGLERRTEWMVRQKALEAILTLPYRADYALRLGLQFGNDDHPWVRRAACLMIARGPKESAGAILRNHSYSPDPEVARLALFLVRHVEDREFALAEIAKLSQSDINDRAFTMRIAKFYCLRAHRDPLVVDLLGKLLNSIGPLRSSKNEWHRQRLWAGIVADAAAHVDRIVA